MNRYILLLHVGSSTARLGLRLYVIAIIALGLALVTQPAHADGHKLVLGDDLISIDTVIIYGGSQQTNYGSLPDSIVISEISLTYAKRSRGELLVVADNDTVFKSIMKNSLNKDEMAQTGGLILHTNRKYYFTHGGKTWSLPASDDVPTYKLTIDNDHVGIEGLGSARNDSLFVPIVGVTLPDSMVISEIVLGYNGRKKNTLVISSSSDTIFTAKFADNLDKSEIKKVGGLTLYTNRNYVLSHGSEQWQLPFVDKTPTEQKSGCGLPWWGYFLIGLVTGLVIRILIRLLKRIRKRDQKGSGNGGESSDGGNSQNDRHQDPEHSTDDAPHPNDSQDFGCEPNNDETKIRERLLQMQPFDEEFSLEEKLEKIFEQLQTWKENSRILDLIKRTLDMGEDAGENILIARIDELKNQAQATEEAKNQIDISEDLKDKVREEVLKMIDENDILKPLVKKAKNECHGSNKDIIKKIINILQSELKDFAQVNSAAQNTDDITEHQLNDTVNQTVVKSWLLNRLEGNGFTNINRNDTLTNIIKEIADRLNQPVAPAEPVDESAIIDKAVKDDNLTEEQRDVIARRLVQLINQTLGKANHLPENVKEADIIRSIADRLQQPTTFEEAQEQTQHTMLSLLNKVLDSDMDEMTQETIKDAVERKLLTRLKGQGIAVDTLKEALELIKSAVKAKDSTEKALSEYGANEISELPEKVKAKLHDDIVKSIANDIETLALEKEYTTTQKLVNALIKRAKTLADQAKASNEDIKQLADEIEEKITIRDSSYVSDGNKKAGDLLKHYAEVTAEAEKELKQEIQTKDGQIAELNGELETKNCEIQALEDKQKELMSATKTMTDRLHAGAERIEAACKTILHPCSDSYDSQCMDIEDRLFHALAECLNRTKAFKIPDDTDPQAARLRIQEVLVSELETKDSPIATVARYYSYCLLPFMTDKQREDGIIFDRKNMIELYDAIDQLYVEFGINIDVPPLFVMGNDEGQFDNMTGQVYGDLDNLCANSRNHLDNIDSQSKPKDVIVDIVAVGYAIDGTTKKRPAVLTY